MPSMRISLRLVYFYRAPLIPLLHLNDHACYHDMNGNLNGGSAAKWFLPACRWHALSIPSVVGDVDGSLHAMENEHLHHSIIPRQHRLCIEYAYQCFLDGHIARAKACHPCAKRRPAGGAGGDVICYMNVASPSLST